MLSSLSGEPLPQHCQFIGYTSDRSLLGEMRSTQQSNNYVGPLQKGQTSNYKLSLKLTKKCVVKKPEDFLEALEESLDDTNHFNHQELMET